ncbi:MAG: MFS transporter [Chloroflexi bacterium]|nr:MFS transporter [Chloroflexota bacterium]
MTTQRIELASSAVALNLAALSSLWFCVMVQRLLLASLIGASSLLADFGITAASAGLLASIYYIAYGAVQIPSGILADEARPKGVILSATLALAIASLLFALAPTYEIAIVLRAIVGIASGFIWLTSLKLMAQIDERGYARWVGAFVSVGSIGTTFSIGVLPLILAYLPWRWTVVLASVPLLVVPLALLRVAEAPKGAGRTERPLGERVWAGLRRSWRTMLHLVRLRRFWLLCFPVMIWNGIHFGMLTWLPRFTRDVLELDIRTTGVLAALIPIGMIAGGYGAGHLFARRRSRGYVMLFGGYAVYGAGLTTIFAATQVPALRPALFPVVLGLGLGYGFCFVGLSLLAEVVGLDELGTASGLYNALGFVPSFIFPWAMGAIMDVIDQPAVADWRYSAAAYAGTFALAVAGVLVSFASAWLLSEHHATNCPAAR